MSFLKSIYFTLYLSFLIFSFFFMGFKLITGELDQIYFFAPFVSTLVLLIYYLNLYVRNPRDVSLSSIIIFTIVGGSFLISLGFFLTEGSDYSYPMIFAGINLLGWILYIIWYVKNKNLSKQMLSGTIKNHFLPQTANYSSKNNFQLYFFRNHTFSPFCQRQEKDFIESAQDFTNRNIDLYIISTKNKENPAHAFIKHIKNLDGKQTKNLGIYQSDRTPFSMGSRIDNRLEVVPLCVLTYKNDEILWIYPVKDDRKRPKPDFFMRIIDQKMGKTV